MRVFTESHVENGTNNFPFSGPNTVEAESWATHPDFESATFLLHDVGVVILEAPGVTGLANYGELPELDALDALAEIWPRKNVTFTTVGYGLRSINPAFEPQDDLVRMVAHPTLRQVNSRQVGDYSLLLTNSGPDGGTCRGDSGGPNFLGDSHVIAGVTTFGTNNITCQGGGGVFRMDRQNVLAGC